jgi:thiol-disulfide isomerase/thioredoxin
MSRTPHLLALILASALALHAQSAQLPDISAAAQAAYKQGLAAESHQQLDIALERFQSSLKQSGACLDCIESIARVEYEMGDHKAALAAAAKMANLTANPKGKARADTLAGRIYFDQYFAYSVGEGAYEKNPGRAQDAIKHAEAAFGRAAKEDPSNEPLLLLHGHLLAVLKHDAEARSEFVACAAVPGTSPTECARALRLSQNIDAARNEPSPLFEATTIDGQKVSLDSLAGKVVLIDFWGSWCPVCVRDAGYVQSMLASFPPDRFVLLEVDSGDSSDHWQNYVKENRLKGVQAQDENSKMGTAFRVSAYPTYVILDGNGSIRFRTRGATGDLRGEIRKLLAEPGPTVASAASSSPDPKMPQDSPRHE